MGLGPNQKSLVAALRSGKYSQGKKALMRVDNDKKKIHYCCLGVACEVAGYSGVVDPYNEKFLKVLENIDYAPGPVVNFFALNDKKGTILDFEESRVTPKGSLVEQNDSGMSFLEIADFIESNADKLFYESR